MSSLAEMRAELREMRKEHVKPVSRMRKGDISAEIERLRHMRETTPAPAATPSAAPRKQESASETIKEAKRTEFPVAPGKAVKDGMKKPSQEKPKADMKSAPKMKEGAKDAKKLTKAEMMKMLSEMKH